jgi:hypothetical protein
MDSVDELFERLARLRNVSVKEVMVEALGVYSYVLLEQEKAQKKGQPFRILIDRGDNKPTHLILPGSAHQDTRDKHSQTRS